jgi:conjugative transfer region protein (TIGR03750 family)
MPDKRNILADRLNVEPAIFRGCTSSELGIIVTLAALIWLPISVLLAWGLGAASMGLGIAGACIFAPAFFSVSNVAVRMVTTSSVSLSASPHWAFAHHPL